jgi:hypothetical protein
MRKLRVGTFAGLLAVVATALAASAFAASSGSPAVHVKAGVTPNKAGTKKKPQGVKLKTKITWDQLGSADQPIVTTFDILFPKGSLYNGGKVTSCSLKTLNNAGPTACNKNSIVGSGTGNAYADTVVTHPKITVVNGGKSKVYFYTVLNNPAVVHAPVVGSISKMHGKWAYKLHVVVPKLLQVVAGVPIELTSLNVTAGKGSWLETTACGPGGKWPFQVTTKYNTGGSASFTDSIACKK